MSSFEDSIERESVVLPIHKCTQEDFDQFYPLDSKYEGDFNAFKDSLQCINLTDDMVIRPNWM